MLTKGRLNVVLPICEDEVKDFEPIIFHNPAIYSTKVKVHDWQMHTLAEPRDNKDMFPPKGNLHRSSYQRFGPEPACTGITETQEMLSQIELKDLYKPVYPQRTLLHMKSFASIEPEEEQETLTDIIYDAEEARNMDYRTTTKIHYRLPYPIKPKPLPPPPSPEPWLLNRRTIGYSLEQLEKRDGMHTFLDDNMELHKQIADLKSKRYKLHTFQESKLSEKFRSSFVDTILHHVLTSIS
ncbi:hypothetical protein WN51_09967 [Melipona quadrifasciata]|uniref:Uncharacterized protein n=1 Tax=Melipona quadrifasciata TaxID=166423 RepID=A0A0N0BKT3_9HYME|nr:hypothetical protein WN51_09967 [Melipona quadrifasciata]